LSERRMNMRLNPIVAVLGVLAVCAVTARVYQVVQNLHPRPPAVLRNSEVDLKVMTEPGAKLVDFFVRNTGRLPLRVTQVVPDCSCLVSDVPRAAILPGKEGRVQLKVELEPHSGPFERRVTVYLSKGGPLTAVIRGEVALPSPRFTLNRPPWVLVGGPAGPRIKVVVLDHKPRPGVVLSPRLTGPNAQCLGVRFRRLGPAKTVAEFTLKRAPVVRASDVLVEIADRDDPSAKVTLRVRLAS